MLPPILCFSNMEWDAPVPTNRQQLMRRFARRTQVAVVEAPLPVLGSVIGRSRRRQRRYGWRRDGDVLILQAWDWLPYPLARRARVISQMADAAFRSFLTTHWKALGWPEPILWLYTSDGGDLPGSFNERLTVYHCVDDHQALEPYNHYRRVAVYNERKREEYLARAADMLVVTAPSLLEKWGRLNTHTHLLPNVADTALFQHALDKEPEHPVLAEIPRPRIGYIGALDSYKVDFALLAEVARLRPDLHIVCVGPVGSGDNTRRASLPQAPNLHYINSLPQSELPAVLRGCAVCLIPYRLNDYTASVSPLKLYEYLAAGRPVVATPLPALQTERARGLLLAENNPAAFVAQIDHALAMGEEAYQQISLGASTHSWEQRADELEALIVQRLEQKRDAITAPRSVF